MRKKRAGSVTILLGLLLIAAAVCVVWHNLREDRVAMEGRDRVLEQIVSQLAQEHTEPHKENEIIYPDYVLNPHMAMPVKTIDGYDYIGVLSVPALEIELPVMDTWDYSRLKVNPCHYMGSVYLNDMVICAHNYRSHFGRLSTLAIDDEVVFTDMDGNVFHYRVAEVTILQPTAITEMTQSGWDLTLFTCTVGGRTRVTVRCENLDKHKQ